jgi:hypothetical protein
MAGLLGFTRSDACDGTNAGGVAQVFASKLVNVTSFTLAAGQKYYDTVTMAATEVFQAYEFEQDTAQLTINTTAAGGAKKGSATLVMDLSKMDELLRDAVDELADTSYCGVVLVVKLTNGTRYVLGYNEADLKRRKCRLESAAQDSNKLAEEETKATLTFQYDCNETPRIISIDPPIA